MEWYKEDEEMLVTLARKGKSFETIKNTLNSLHGTSGFRTEESVVEHFNELKDKLGITLLDDHHHVGYNRHFRSRLPRRPEKGAIKSITQRIRENNMLKENEEVIMSKLPKSPSHFGTSGFRHWSLDEMKSLVELRVEGKTYQECSLLMEKEFGVKRSMSALSKKMNKLIVEGVVSSHEQEVIEEKRIANAAHRIDTFQKKSPPQPYYSKAEIVFIIMLRNEKQLKWKEISKEVERVFGIKRAANTISVMYRLRKGKEWANYKTVQPVTLKIETPLKSSDKIVSPIEPTHSEIVGKLIKNVKVIKTTDKIRENLPNPKKLKKTSGNVYSVEERERIANLRDMGNSYRQISSIIEKEFDNVRSVGALSWQMRGINKIDRLEQHQFKMRKQQEQSEETQESALALPPSIASKYAKSNEQVLKTEVGMYGESAKYLTRQGCIWTKEEDINLVVVWGRPLLTVIKKLNRSYGACANRYERLILDDVSHRLDVIEIAKNRLKMKEWQSKRINRLFLHIRTKRQNRLEKKIAKLNERLTHNTQRQSRIE